MWRDAGGLCKNPLLGEDSITPDDAAGAAPTRQLAAVGTPCGRSAVTPNMIRHMMDTWYGNSGSGVYTFELQSRTKPPIASSKQPAGQGTMIKRPRSSRIVWYVHVARGPRRDGGGNEYNIATRLRLPLVAAIC